MAPRPKPVEKEFSEDDYISGTYNVIRKDYYGDSGKVVGTGLSKEQADLYVATRKQENEACHYEVVAK